MARIEVVRPFSQTLVDSCGAMWSSAVQHPFVLAAGNGTLDARRFHVWIQQDRRFVQGLALFIDKLIATAPRDDHEGLQSGRAALDPELALFEQYAKDEHIRLDVRPLPVCEEYLGFFGDCADRGHAHALVAYYACERAYLEAWQHVLERSGTAGPYAEWVANWTSEPFAAYVSWLGSRVDALGYDGEQDALAEVFARTVALEIAFWDACLTAD